MPTKIVDVTAAELTRAKGAQTAAQQSLGAAQQALVAAQADQATKGTELQALDAQIAKIRADLGVATMPADADALSLALEQAIMSHRAKQNEVVEAEAAVDAAQRRLTGADDELKARSAAAAAAQLADDAATARQKERDIWATAVGAAPLSTLKNDAQTAIGAELQTAKNKLDADIPNGLRQRALERAKAERQGRENAAKGSTDAEDALAGVLATAPYGDDGDVTAAAIPFARADNALRDFVQLGKERLDRALALITAVVGARAPTQAELDRMNAAEFTTPAADNDPKVNFLKAEAARDAKRAAVATAQAALDAAVLAAKTQDPDDPNPTNADITKAQTDLGKAVGELGDAETDFKPALHTALRTWAATVPDETWRALEAFEEAEAILTDLAATTGSSLVTKLKNTEDAFATATQTAAKDARARAFVVATVATRERALATADRLADARRFAALRGDR